MNAASLESVGLPCGSLGNCANTAVVDGNDLADEFVFTIEIIGIIAGCVVVVVAIPGGITIFAIKKGNICCNCRCDKCYR